MRQCQLTHVSSGDCISHQKYTAVSTTVLVVKLNAEVVADSITKMTQRFKCSPKLVQRIALRVLIGSNYLQRINGCQADVFRSGQSNFDDIKKILLRVITLDVQ